MKKRFVAVLLLVTIIISISSNGIAAYNPNTINSDPVFASITTSLSSVKSATFSAETDDDVGYIRVVSCWLQKKENNSWVYVRVLPAPTDVFYNTFGYEAYKDYSTYIPSDGNTYRIGVRWEADGHFVTRYSNQRTF